MELLLSQKNSLKKGATPRLGGRNTFHQPEGFTGEDINQELGLNTCSQGKSEGILTLLNH